MNPLIAELSRRFPQTAVADLADLVNHLPDPAAVLANMTTIQKYVFTDDEDIPEDETFSGLAYRDNAKVRVMLVKGSAKLFLGPAWYDYETTGRHWSWDWRCTCGEEGSIYFAEDMLDQYESEARQHMEESH